MTDTPVLRVAIFREGPYWLAQGLEHDIGTQAGNLRDLVARFHLVLGLETAALRDLPPAPKYFQDIWMRHAGTFHPGETSAIAPTAVTIAWGLVA